jgi:hypothetical protein
MFMEQLQNNFHQINLIMVTFHCMYPTFKDMAVELQKVRSIMKDLDLI